MNYQGYSNLNAQPGFRNHPAHFSNAIDDDYDRGNGIRPIDENNLSIRNLYLTPFLFLQEHRKNYNSMAPIALKGIQSESELSKLFFSDDNFKRLQKMIKKEVFIRTGGEFKLEVDQEQRDLFIAMRAVYLENARMLENQIVRQVKRLNQKVVSEVVPGIITNVKQYFGYLREINKNPTPFPRMGVSHNRGARKTLPSITTVWGID